MTVKSATNNVVPFAARKQNVVSYFGGNVPVDIVDMPLFMAVTLMLYLEATEKAPEAVKELRESTAYVLSEPGRRAPFVGMSGAAYDALKGLNFIEAIDSLKAQFMAGR